MSVGGLIAERLMSVDGWNLFCYYTHPPLQHPRTSTLPGACHRRDLFSKFSADTGITVVSLPSSQGPYLPKIETSEVSRIQLA